MYEPKNREAEELPILQVRVEHADGVFVSNPNGIAASAIWELDGKKPDLPENFLMGADLFRPSDLKPIDGVVSIISGRPAVIYAADDFRIPLATDELSRLMRHDLTAVEYVALREHYGMFHEIHEDFYDPDHHFACQPMRREPDVGRPEDGGPIH